MSFREKYIAKMFNLNKFLVNEYNSKLVFVRAVGNQGYIYVNCIRCKILEQIRISKVYLHVF